MVKCPLLTSKAGPRRREKKSTLRLKTVCGRSGQQPPKMVAKNLSILTLTKECSHEVFPDMMYTYPGSLAGKYRERVHPEARIHCKLLPEKELPGASFGYRIP